MCVTEYSAEEENVLQHESEDITTQHVPPFASSGETQNISTVGHSTSASPYYRLCHKGGMLVGLLSRGIHGSFKNHSLCGLVFLCLPEEGGSLHFGIVVVVACCVVLIDEHLMKEIKKSSCFCCSSPLSFSFWLTWKTMSVCDDEGEAIHLSLAKTLTLWFSSTLFQSYCHT